MKLNTPNGANEIYDLIANGQMTKEQFCHLFREFKTKISVDTGHYQLEARMWKTRYECSNRLATSYMQHFQDFGLMQKIQSKK